MPDVCLICIMLLKRPFFILLILLVPVTGFFALVADNEPDAPEAEPNDERGLLNRFELLYRDFGIEEKVCYDAFEKAMIGYLKLKPEKEVLTIIDFSKPSLEERLVVLDISSKETLFCSVVAHGKNSGENYATRFSNKPGSYQSSLGFYKTLGTYRGGNGYSMQLQGLEKGINDKALARAIVMHGADYAVPCKKAKRLGRSFGCPALPPTINKPVIDAIKNGSLLFIYADSFEYSEKSEIV